MFKQTTSILNLPIRKKAIINSIHGGYGFQRKLHVMGIRPGQAIRVVSAQPFKGPITIEVCGCQMTLGRGMAKKIIVEDFR
jgi:Fe2+ transport system protein FeoA